MQIVRQKNLVIPMPPPGVFEKGQLPKPPDVLDATRQQEERLRMIDHVDYPEAGGQHIYYVGVDVPRKGFPYPAGVEAIRDPKRILLSWVQFIVNKGMWPLYIVFMILPHRMKGAIITRFIEGYLRICDHKLESHYICPRFQTEIARELRIIIRRMMLALGIKRDIAKRFARLFSHFIEYDSAYRYKLLDIFTESSREKIMANPSAEAMRLLEIFLKREMIDRDTESRLAGKFRKFALIAKYGSFYLKGPIRKAFEKANFANLQFDDIDRHEVKHTRGYAFFGMTIEERLKKYEPTKYIAHRLK